MLPNSITSRVLLTLFGATAFILVLVVYERSKQDLHTTDIRVARLATGARPVNVVVVAPELINGIAVPAEPSSHLNNSTLAGFDANGNGVRDDVERLIAKAAMNRIQFENAMVIAKAYESILLTIPLSQATYDSQFLKISCADLVALEAGTDNILSSSQIEPAILNSDARKNAYKAQVRTISGHITDARKECK